MWNKFSFVKRNYAVGLLVVVCAGFGTFVSSDVPEPILTLEQGVVQGRKALDLNDHIFYSFQGIPYAKPALGDLRFKAPQPLDKWNGTLLALKEGSPCPQITYLGVPKGNEDCLFLNVYTPVLNPTGNKDNLLDVFVWIHGGTFVEGSGNTDIHGPEKLVGTGTVLVTFNYRLSTLGFLSFSDPKLDISGNSGLKDQVLVLKWVQQNIIYFGGDPNRVTLGGNSAGAVSVDLHIVSPMARGLFHRATVQSGCATAFWASRGRSTAIELAKYLNKAAKIETEADALDILKTIPAMALIKGQMEIADPNTNEGVGVSGPIVESRDSRNPFLTEQPINIIKRGNFSQVPYMIGYNSLENQYVLISYKLFPSKIPKKNRDFQKLLAPHFNLEVGSQKLQDLTDKVLKFYFGNETPSAQNLDKNILMQSDFSFVYPIQKHAALMAEKSSQPVYLYRFSLDTEMNLYKRQLNTSGFPGAAHTDEKGYIFNFDGAPEIVPGTPVDTYVRRMLTLWTNFFHYGNPNGPSNSSNSSNLLQKMTWTPVQPSMLNYLEIGENLTSSTNPDEVRVNFWNGLADMLQTTFVQDSGSSSRQILCIFTVVLVTAITLIC